LFESHKARMQLHSMRQEQTLQSEAFYQFTHALTHDIKSPLSSIVLVSEMLREYFGDAIVEENEQLLGVLNRATAKIRKLLEDIQPDGPAA
jgi:signal transduction histidine kinase